jgi:hypothetical protein
VGFTPIVGGQCLDQGGKLGAPIGNNPYLTHKVPLW